MTNDSNKQNDSKTFRSVALEEEDYDEIKQLSTDTGHPIGYHLKRAVQRYMYVEAPEWRTALGRMQKRRDVEKAKRQTAANNAVAIA